MLVNAIFRALIMMVSGILLIRLAGIDAWPPLWQVPFAWAVGWCMAVGWFDYLDRVFDGWGFLMTDDQP